MGIKIFLLFIFVGLLGPESARGTHNDEIKEVVPMYLGKFLMDNHQRIKESIAKDKSIPPHRLQEFEGDRLLEEAIKALPYSAGHIKAAFDNLMYGNGLNNGFYREPYREHGISDKQITQAKFIVERDSTALKSNLETDLDLSGLPFERQEELLKMHVGSELIETIQKEMNVDEEIAIIIYQHIQLAYSKGGDDDSAWRPYALAGIAGLGLGALFYAQGRRNL